MGLATGLYRRQAVYWWRRRFADPQDGRSREIAISLRIQRPDVARRIADALNDKAHSVAKRLELRMSTFESARHDLAEVVNTIAFTLDADAEASLCAIEARRRTSCGRVLPVPTREQEHDLLVLMGREAEADLIRSAHYNRYESAKCGDYDPVAGAIASEQAFAVIFTAIASGGNAGSLNHRSLSLTAQFSPEMIGFIEREITFHATRERDVSWSLGPPRIYFETKMRAFGLEPSLDAIRVLRREYLLLVAALLEKADSRYRPSTVDTALNALADEARRAALPENDSAPAKRLVPDMQILPSAIVPITACLPASLTGRPSQRKSFTAHVETLVRQKCKAGLWTPKTCRQHESVARLFVKLVGSDDPHLMRQEHVGAFRSLLDDLPKNWGKSPRDADRTIEDICARAQDLDADEIGLMPGTIDRQLTQLSNLLAHLRDNGIEAGEVTAKMRTGGANARRGIFSLDEYAIFFNSSVFTGCKSTDERLAPGETVIHDDQFFVPILGRYTLGRLNEIAGLTIADIDFDGQAIIFQDNEERRVKTEGTKRRQPAVPEIVRLGFFDYCNDLRAAGHTLVFPSLRERGAKTPLSNLAYKKLKLLLDAVLPLAAEQRKSFHSFRKDGNTLMSNANINDVIRHAVMGHAHSGVNERHYLDTIYDEAKLMALSTIPVVTAHLKPYRRKG